jgi:hypothetical protein
MFLCDGGMFHILAGNWTSIRDRTYPRLLLLLVVVLHESVARRGAGVSGDRRCARTERGVLGPSLLDVTGGYSWATKHVEPKHPSGGDDRAALRTSPTP